MQPNDWSQFLLRIPIQAPTDTIYQCWTPQDGLESWFLRKAIFTAKEGIQREQNRTIEVEDTYEWLWHGWSDVVVERGTIPGLNGKGFLKFSFGKAGNVSVSIRQEANETLWELWEHGIPANADRQMQFYLGCSRDWLFYHTHLKSVAEGCIDLRNRKVEIQNVINA